MSEIKFYLNGSEAQPHDRKEIRYRFDFNDRTVRELELSVENLTFVKEDFTAIQNWLDTYGYSVGMPFQVEYETQTIDYYLDFQSPNFVKRDRSMTVPVKRLRATDNFFDNANGLSFSSVTFSNSDFTDVDYVVISQEQFSYYISLSLATFSLAQELAKSIQEIQEGIADLVKATTPVGIPPAPDWGAIVVAAIKLAARIAYTIFIIIALIKLATEILNAIFPKIRQFQGCSIKTLVQRGCDELGYTLQSTLLNSLQKLVILPTPLREKDPSFFKELFAPASLAYTYGYPTSKDGIFTLGQLITQIENIFNAKTKVVNGVVTIEQRTYFEQNASGLIPSAFTDQSALQSENTINTEEIPKRLVMNYPVDVADFNTLDDTRKSVYEVSSEVINSIGSDYELNKGIDLIQLPFARGTRKDDLTFVEKIAKTFAKAIDVFTGGSLSSKVESRIGVLQISQQYFSVPKWLWMNGNRIDQNQNSYIGCEALVTGYHSDNYIENNQRDLFNGMPLALTQEELFNILANNFINLNNGKIAEITSVDWSEYEHEAVVNFNIKRESVNEKTVVINAG